MAVVRLSKAAPRAMQIKWWQAGKAAPIDCTGWSVTVAETALPFEPEIVAVDEAAGLFRVLPPAPADADLLRVGHRYGLHLVLRNALGEAQEDVSFEIEAV